MVRLRSPAHRHLLAMLAWVLALDAVAIGVYFAAGLATASGGVRTGFTAAWTLATLAVVGVYLRRIRLERYRQR